MPAAHKAGKRRSGGKAAAPERENMEKVMFRLPPSLKKQADRAAREMGLSPSSWFRMIVKRAVDQAR